MGAHGVKCATCSDRGYMPDTDEGMAYGCPDCGPLRRPQGDAPKSPAPAGRDILREAGVEYAVQVFGPPSEHVIVRRADVERLILKAEGAASGGNFAAIPDAAEVPVVACHDCGLAYNSDGWIECVVPNDVWLRISPTGHEGGILCISCIARRLTRLGVDRVPVKLCGTEPIRAVEQWPAASRVEETPVTPDWNQRRGRAMNGPPFDPPVCKHCGGNALHLRDGAVSTCPGALEERRNRQVMDEVVASCMICGHKRKLVVWNEAGSGVCSVCHSKATKP